MKKIKVNEEFLNSLNNLKFEDMIEKSGDSSGQMFSVVKSIPVEIDNSIKDFEIVEK